MSDRIKRKERITEARTKQILDAAFKVFSTKGTDKATMADIANEAHIGVGTIYNYYKDKHALWIALISDTLLSEQFSQMLDKIREPLSLKNNLDVMQLMLEERLGFALGNAQKFIFLFFELQRNTKLRKQYYSSVFLPLIGILEDYLRVQTKLGHFRKIDEKMPIKGKKALE